MDTRQFAEELIEVGSQMRASDIYIFPKKIGYEITYRCHNSKKIYQVVQTEEAEKLILYFKYLAEMDVAEKRRTQVGSGTLRLKKGEQRLRLSTVADYKNRESLVIRFLQSFSHNELHYFFPEQLEFIKLQLHKRGLYLFCGPTGSGKTTTMYYLANLLSSSQKQVVAIEDPVEIEVDDFLQMQTNEKIGLSFDELVKVCLRHRPDILIVGEIRDTETAKSVIRAALTGHTVFSTVHAGSKEMVIPRLIELGISKSDIYEALVGVIYQRLLPVSCPICEIDSLDDCTHIPVEEQHKVLFDYAFLEGRGNESKWTSKTNWEQTLSETYATGLISKENWEIEKN